MCKSGEKLCPYELGFFEHDLVEELGEGLEGLWSFGSVEKGPATSRAASGSTCRDGVFPVHRGRRGSPGHPGTEEAARGWSLGVWRSLELSPGRVDGKVLWMDCSLRAPQPS